MGATKKKKAMKMDKVIKYLIFGLLVLLILFGSALMINAYFKRMGAEGPFSKGEEKVITDSVLKDMVEVEELSSLKFRYNGIANYKDKVGINYKSTVTAKIDMNKYIQLYPNASSFISDGKVPLDSLKALYGMMGGQ